MEITELEALQGRVKEAIERLNSLPEKYDGFEAYLKERKIKGLGRTGISGREKILRQLVNGDELGLRTKNQTIDKLEFFLQEANSYYQDHKNDLDQTSWMLTFFKLSPKEMQQERSEHFAEIGHALLRINSSGEIELYKKENNKEDYVCYKGVLKKVKGVKAFIDDEPTDYYHISSTYENEKITQLITNDLVLYKDQHALGTLNFFDGKRIFACRTMIHFLGEGLSKNAAFVNMHMDLKKLHDSPVEFLGVKARNYICAWDIEKDPNAVLNDTSESYSSKLAEYKNPLTLYGSDVPGFGGSLDAKDKYYNELRTLETSTIEIKAILENRDK
ncbi:MAG: hypothetical protein AAFY41_12535, partial [Bacteroidota bacterium]